VGALASKLAQSTQSTSICAMVRYFSAGTSSKTFRPRRSFLYIPGSSEKMLAKAPGTGADTVCLDLEDAVSYNMKEEARKYITKAINSTDYGNMEVIVRINPIATELGRRDLDYFLEQSSLPMHGFCVPKLETVDELTYIHEKLSSCEKERGLPPLSKVVIGLIETPVSMINLKDILASQGRSRLGAVIFGGDDYANAVGATRTDSNEEIAFARNWVLLHAAAAGIQAIDIVHKDFKDTQGLIEECKLAAQRGYTGKQLIHPSQVAPANQYFAPDPKVVQWSKRVVEAAEQNEKEGRGAFAIDGIMIDAPTIKLARRQLARARACGMDV